MLVLKSLRKYFAVTGALLLTAPAWAAGSPAPNPLYNPFAILLICIMIILLIAIAILGSVLTGTADVSLMKWKRKKETEKKSTIGHAAAVLIGLMLLSPAMFAQENSTGDAVQTAASSGGLAPSVFYVMISIILLELLIVLVLLINIRLLVKSQKETLAMAAGPGAVVPKKPRVSLWNRFNKFKPGQEADRGLGHNYDGLRKLNKRLAPWWIYGFCVTIVFAAIYLWKYHVSHTAPLSKREYKIAVQKADQKVQRLFEAKRTGC